jgi:hypothetical protein
VVHVQAHIRRQRRWGAGHGSAMRAWVAVLSCRREMGARAQFQTLMAGNNRTERVGCDSMRAWELRPDADLGRTSRRWPLGFLIARRDALRQRSRLRAAPCVHGPVELDDRTGLSNSRGRMVAFFLSFSLYCMPPCSFFFLLSNIIN